METVTYVSKPDALWPCGREGATHDAIAGTHTACGRVIGSENDGWIHAGKPVDCKRCLKALRLASSYLDRTRRA